MIQNILSKLPGLKSDAEEVEPVLSDEDLKAERIAFHRDRVHNGPVKFSAPTSGQIRRAQHRDLARKTKKARRRQVNAHFGAMQEIAILRGHLQAVGIILYRSHHKPGAGDVINSMTWIIRRFADAKRADETGGVVVTEDVVRESLQAALNRYQHLTRQDQTALSPAYELPVAVSA